MSKGGAGLTAGGNLKRARISDVCGWIKRSWDAISDQIIFNSFKKCAISNLLDGSEDDMVYEEIDKLIEEYEKENDFSFNMLFSYAYSQALNNQFQLPNNDVEDSLDNLISSLSESSSSSETTRLLTLWLRSKSSTDANNHIYKEWYSLIQNPTPQKWNLLNDILKKEQVQ